MEESGAQDGDPSDANGREGVKIIDVVTDGDVVLDVTFETSRDTLKSAKKASQLRPGQSGDTPMLRSKLRIAYRVDLATLKRLSKYFSHLLGNVSFDEARAVESAHSALTARGLKPAEAASQDLPWVSIVDDDDATRAAGREVAFEDLMRILHEKQTVAKNFTMLYVTLLAVLADRFDCITPVSRFLNTILKFKWPATAAKPIRAAEEGSVLSQGAEEVLRQKILVSWLLNQPIKLHASSRELILHGSRRWSSFAEDDAELATWWDLQDDLERELQYRRECILNTIASVQSHFLRLYTSRARQCKLGYDSSASCDSYQLGQMLKFLTSRKLLFLIDYSSKSLDSYPDLSLLDINHILHTLKQSPSYQIDKNHTNCGLRTRILPIVEYIQTMLSSNVISIARQGWKSNRAGSSWIRNEEEEGKFRDNKTIFRFTRAVAGDQRLRYEGAMAVDRSAKALFTADEWDWTPED